MDKREREALRERLKAEQKRHADIPASMLASGESLLVRDLLAILDLADAHDRLCSWAERARGVLEEAVAEYDAGMARVTNANYDDAAGLGSDLREALAPLLTEARRLAGDADKEGT